MRFWAHEVAEATGGQLFGADVAIDGVSFDSRSVQPGQLFVALVDQRDGHDFIPDAIAAGAVAYLGSRVVGSRVVDHAGGAAAVVVADPLRALMELAADRRRRSSATVIGITGSVGKTSTKDLAWAALGASRRTWANERSFNNDQGMPTTILTAPDDTEVLVLEMGMRGMGEIARLCQVAQPQVGVVTRVAEAHSDRVGGIEGVARAKVELVEALPSTGTAILNGDDIRVAAMASRCAGRSLTFGEGRGADVLVEHVTLDDMARPRFVVATPWGRFDVKLGVSGRHMALNAAAALACVGVVDGDVAAAAEALSAVSLTAMRMQITRTRSGITVLDDSYNANPTSMRAAIDALVALPATRRIAVLGLMAEISDAETEHRAIAAYARERDVDVVTTGTELYGLEPVADPLDAIGPLEPGTAVLVKGSRVAGLERVAAAVIARY